MLKWPTLGQGDSVRRAGGLAMTVHLPAAFRVSTSGSSYPSPSIPTATQPPDGRQDTPDNESYRFGLAGSSATQLRPFHLSAIAGVEDVPLSVPTPMQSVADTHDTAKNSS
jgi:hypothetical protein